MAAQGGRTDPPLERRLFGEPYRFGFFQAVRLLARLDPAREPVGGDARPGREVVRFRALTSLAFPASEVHRIEPAGAEGGPPVMTVSFLGLTGPLGVLPTPYTEFLLARRRAGDPTAAAFLDLFNHRMASLFFRAWAKYRPALARERDDAADDPLARCLFALMGIGTDSLRGRHTFPDDALLGFAGLFAQRRRPAAALEALLRDTFGVEVEVVQFVGRWLTLDPSDRSALGRGGPHNGLGSGLMLGARAWDVQGAFRLRVGPLTFERFLNLSPDGGEFLALTEMARVFVDGELDFDVQLVLKAEEVPACLVASAPGAGARLGRTAWLKSLPTTADADDAVFPSPR